MTCKTLVTNLLQKNEELLHRGIVVTQDVSGDQLNIALGNEWSPAQVFDHLTLGNAIYIQTIQSGLDSAKTIGEDLEARGTWFGRIIEKGAGPNGNAPVPKSIRPRSGFIEKTIVDKWVDQQREIIRLLNVSKDKNIRSAYVKNPFFKLIRMNLVDCLRIITAHTERHVAQIEERIYRNKRDALNES